MPAEALSSSLFLPLTLAAILYVALYVTANVLSGRSSPAAQKMFDAAFVVLLLAAVYTVVLLLIALASEFKLITDAVIITLICVVFFGALLAVLFVVFDLGVGAISRARRRG